MGRLQIGCLLGFRIGLPPTGEIIAGKIKQQVFGRVGQRFVQAVAQTGCGNLRITHCPGSLGHLRIA